MIAIIGYLLLAVVFILDKLIVSTAKEKPSVYAFYTSIFMFGAVLLLPFTGWGLLKGIDWVWAIVSGMAFGLAMWALFVADEKGEATHIAPFNGAFVTIVISLLGYYFLAEKLTGLQIGGMLVLIFASLLLSAEKSKKHNGFHLGFVWAIISAVLFAVSHVSAKFLYSNYPFWTGFVWTRATAGLVGVFLLLLPVVRKKLFAKKKSSSSASQRHSLAIIFFNKVLSVIAIVLLQYAIALGSVTLVNALSGLQYVLMFVLIYLSTKFLPKFFKEYFTKREITVEVIAIILVVIGLAFFVL